MVFESQRMPSRLLSLAPQVRIGQQVWSGCVHPLAKGRLTYGETVGRLLPPLPTSDALRGLTAAWCVAGGTKS